jgi:riboflavin kinase/FMN adenylyltransferase
MKIIRTSFDEEIAELAGRKVVLAIGVFDGVHVGHRFLLKQAVQFASSLEAAMVAYTFWPYPTHFYAKNPKKIILSRGRKFEILAALGVQFAVEQCFDARFSKILCGDFVDFLRGKFHHLAGICVGSDFKFGHNRMGDAIFLQKLCDGSNILFKEVPEFCLNSERVSSSQIRDLLEKCNFSIANELLGNEAIC